ncbi:MAG: DUF192 domain-containing protein [Pseudomonadota bacterium]
MRLNRLWHLKRRFIGGLLCFVVLGWPLAGLAIGSPVSVAQAEYIQSQYSDARPQTGLAEEPLVVKTQTGQRHDFTVEMAITPREQAVGMMYRRKAPRDRGMLFPFDAPKIASFWMKNTLVPLDLLFIKADGIISDIHARAVPLSEQSISSTAEVIAVLELAGGETDRRDIRVGDRVLHPLFAD